MVMLLHKEVPENVQFLLGVTELGAKIVVSGLRV